MKHTNILKTVLLGSTALFTPVALAQEVSQSSDPNERVTILERIIVGAGNEKVAIDTPQSVTVIEQEDIDRAQVDTISDVIREIPGVNATGSERPLGQSFNVRGIGAPESTGDQGRIIVNVDGVNKFYEQYRRGSFYSDPELYKKVEVLRGPASSTLYGSGAIGGVINFETKDASDFLNPGDTGFFKAKTSYSSNPDMWLRSFIFAHQLTENANFLLTGNYRSADNYSTGNGAVVPGTDYEAWSGLAKLTWQTDGGGELKLSYQRWHTNADNQAYDRTRSPGTISFGTIDRSVQDTTAVLSYENEFADNDWLDLNVSLAYSNSTTEQRNASGIAASPPFVPAITCSTTGSVLFCDSDYGYKNLQFNIDNTIETRGDMWENFVTVGYQYSRLERTAVDVTGTFPTVGFHPEGEDEKHGFFAQNEFIYDQRLTIIPGIRVETRSLTDTSNTLGIGSSDDSAVSPKIAAHYKFNDNIAFFGSFAHTERLPTIDEVFSTSTDRATFQPSTQLTKEEADNWEFGVALSGEDLIETGDSFQLKATYFDNSIEGLIATNPNLVRTPRGAPGGPTANAIPGFVNIDNAEIDGFELEASYAAESWYLNAAYTRTSGIDTATNAELVSIAPEELSFTVGAFVPDHDLELGWKSRFVSDPNDACRISSVELPSRGAGVCAGGSTLRFSENFDVHNVFLTWKPEEGDFEGWEVRLGVDNVFDTQYKEFLSNDPAQGRTFKFTLAKSIGWQ